MPINLQPSNEFMIPSEDMVFGFEFKKLGSKRHSSSKIAKESSALPQLDRSPNPKGADKLRSKSGVGPQCSDLKQKAKQDVEGNIRNRETAKRSGNERDELVKHMSNLPGYLLHNDRLENVQEKAFNVGVLDWSRLEKWKHKHIPEELTNHFTSVNRGESSSRIVTKSSLSAGGREKLDDTKSLRDVRRTNKESLHQSSKLPLEDIERFEFSRSGTKSIGNEQRRNGSSKITLDAGYSASKSRHHGVSSSIPYENVNGKDKDNGNSASKSRHHRVSSSIPYENVNGNDKDDEYYHKKKERNRKSSCDMIQPSVKSKGKEASFSSKKLSSSNNESILKGNQLLESGSDNSFKNDHSKPSNIVLLYPHETSDSSSSDDFRLSEFRTSSDENCPESSRSSLSYVSVLEEDYIGNVGPEIRLSSGRRSVVEHTSFSGPMQHSVSTTYLGMNHSSAVSEKSASKINEMPGMQSEAACFEKEVLENRLSIQSAFSNLIESLDQETAELTSQKGMNTSSHNRRFSFSLSRIGRSFSFKEGPAVSQFGSKYVCSNAIAWLLAQLLTSSTMYNNKPESTQNNCRTDRAGLITSAPWVYFPYPFQWGSPTFNYGDTFAMLAASFVSLFDSTGTFYAAARYGSATPVPPSVISRGAGWLGVASLLNGMFGSLTGSAASVENAGLLALTRVGSRRVIQISAGFMIFFSVFGKFGAVFASIPLPIIAALYCVFFGYVSSAGLGFLQFCNLNSFRTKFVLGFSFFLGVSIPQYFKEYYQVKHEHAGWFNDVLIVIFASHTMVAALVAFILDLTLAREEDAASDDSGLKWWEKFSIYGSDVRSNEFYGLPCRLNELFPAL